MSVDVKSQKVQDSMTGHSNIRRHDMPQPLWL